VVPRLISRRSNLLVSGVVVAVTAISVLLLVVPTAASATTPTNFRLAVTGVNGIAGGSQSLNLTTGWIETSVPHVGRALVQTSFDWCSAFACGGSGRSWVTVRIAAKAGTIVIEGPSSAGPNVFFNIPVAGSWSVIQATGRFARYTGAGTYLLIARPGPSAFQPITTIALAGHLGKR
jgi:hypothetical protein